MNMTDVRAREKIAGEDEQVDPQETLRSKDR